MAAPTNYYVDPSIAGDSGTGTIGDPYGDLQYALNTVTRDSTNGDQFNIKAGTSEFPAAALSIATYGTPTAAAPLLFRGYTATANDSGVGVIDGGDGDFAIWAGSGVDYTHFVDLRLRNTGTAHVITVRNHCSITRCEVDTTASGRGIYLTGASYAAGCYVHDTGSYGIEIDGGGTALYNHVEDCGSGAGYYGIGITGSGAKAIGNVVRCTGANEGIRVDGYGVACINNSVWSNAGTGYGIRRQGSTHNATIINNVVVGFSGVGGVGVSVGAADQCCVEGMNAAYNCTTAFAISGNRALALGGDATLAADPFVDAANGDFSLTGAGRAALRSAGWPSTYLGASANMDAHVTIGAVNPLVTVNLLRGKLGG